MKTLIILLFLACPFLINAQAIRIPDPVFRQQIIALGYDLNDNGKIEISEAKEVKELVLTNLGIVNLEGINSFTNLEELQIEQNRIAKLDVSKLKNLTGLYAWDNPLTEVNVTGLTKLKNLHVHGIWGISYIKTLDVSTLSSLKDLRCSKNWLTNLDVSGLDKLEWLDCQNNRLESVSLRKAPNLKYVNLDKNPLQITVDIRGLVNLEYFNCRECNLIVMNLSGTVKLKELIW